MWDGPGEGPLADAADDDDAQAFADGWEAKRQKLRTATGIDAALQDNKFGAKIGPEHFTWKQAASLLIDDIGTATFDLDGADDGEQSDSLTWRRAIWAFTWPLTDADASRATSPCCVRVWTSPGVPEDYQLAHDSTENDAFTEVGRRVAALRAWDTTDPWNTYLIHIRRAGVDSYNHNDAAWWQTRPADYFAQPGNIVSSLAGIFPAKARALT